MSADISAFRAVEPQPIDLMLVSRSVQPRAGMDEDTVAEYAVAMERGDVFPPLLVVETPSEFLLIDGWHRREAAQRLGVDSLPARVVRGSEEVAVELAAMCNARHGRPRSAADLAKVLAMLTALPRWRQATDASLAAHCRVSRQALQRARSGGSEFGKAILPTTEQDTPNPLKELEADSGATWHQEISPPRIVQRGGRQYEMQVGKIGHQRQDANGKSTSDLDSDAKWDVDAPFDEPQPVKPADIGAQHRRQREAAERATLRALDVGQIVAWLGRAVDSERREVAVEAFRQIRADAERNRVFDEVVRPWLDEIEKNDAIEPG